MNIREALSPAIFLAFLLFFLSQALSMLAPYFSPLFYAMLVAVVFYPMHERIGRRRKPLNRSMQALCSVLAVVCFLVLPFMLLSVALVSESRVILPDIRPHVAEVTQWIRALKVGDSSSLAYLPSWATRHLDLTPDVLTEKIASITQTLSERFAEMAGALVSGIAVFSFDLVLFLLALFFVFRDGSEWFHLWNESLPFPQEVKVRLHNRARVVVSGVLRGSLLIAAGQGLLMTVSYILAGTRAAFLLGSLTTLASLLPGVGTLIVWGPLCAYYSLGHSYGTAALIAAFGAMAALSDNFFRPMLIGKEAELPFFWFTFAVLGGLKIYGLKGLLVGPLVFALLPILLDIYRLQFLKPRE